MARAREKMLRNEQVTALGALAAGAAHELSTPLSTMAMIVGELRERGASPADIDQNLATLEQQIELCTHQINHLLGAAEHARGEDPEAMTVRRWLESVIDRWRLMRPEVRLDVNLYALTNNPHIALDDSVSQALTNLLNNSADASLENNVAHIRLSARCDHANIAICTHFFFFFVNGRDFHGNYKQKKKT